MIWPSESSWNEDEKIGIGLICSSNTSEKINKIFFPKKLGFIDVLPTVFWNNLKETLEFWKCRILFCVVSCHPVDKKKHVQHNFSSPNKTKLIWIYGRKKRRYSAIKDNKVACKTMRPLIIPILIDNEWNIITLFIIFFSQILVILILFITFFED